MGDAMLLVVGVVVRSNDFLGYMYVCICIWIRIMIRICDLNELNVIEDHIYLL